MTRPGKGLHNAEDLELLTPSQEATRRLLLRIAGTLQVPLSALYKPPNAVDGKPPSTPVSALSEVSDAERIELLKAFNSVRDLEDRRRILAFVREMVERS